MKNKNKKIVFISALLGSIALASTGFASWVITTQDSKPIKGNVNVETVTDASHTLTVNLKIGQKGSLVFGATTTSVENPNPWLTYSGESENLTIVYDVECTNYLPCNVGTALTFSKPTPFVGLVSSKYVTEPTVELSTFTAKEGNSTTGVATLTLSAAWGEHFGGNNPFEYYNSKSPADYASDEITYASDAKTALNAIYTALYGVKYTITVSTTAK
ncbi:MAG: hypothetical protein PUA56_06085 [Bacillales bacterium]|nr:hypothetical protein [Bacillales bacterium]